MAIIKVVLDEGTHRNFKVWCVESGISMQTAVVRLITRLVDSTVEPPVKPRKVPEIVKEVKSGAEAPKVKDGRVEVTKDKPLMGAYVK